MIVKSFQNKMKSERGATLMAALLLFVMCAVVGSVVLAAASSSAGRASKANTDANRQRYSLESAANVILHELGSVPATGSGEATVSGSDMPEDLSERTGMIGWSNGLQIREKWKYRTIKVDKVFADGVASEGQTEISIEGESDDGLVVEGKLYKSAGNYVMGLDQVGGDLVKYEKTGDEKDEPEYGGVIDETTNVWDQTNYASGNNLVMASVAPSVKGNHSTTFSSIKDLKTLRDVMAEAIYRRYWDKISLYKLEDETSSQAATMEDPWNGHSPKNIQNWQQVTAGDDYKIETPENAPLEIKVADADPEQIYPVFADITMDSDFKMIIHLYCGSSEQDTLTSVRGNPQNASSELWLTVEPKENTPTVKFKSNEQSAILTMPPLKVRREEKNISFPGIVNEGELNANYTEDDDVYRHYKYRGYDAEKELTYFDCTVVTKYPRNKQVVWATRSATFQVEWKTGEITSIRPADDAKQSVGQGSDLSEEADRDRNTNQEKGSSDQPAEAESAE